MLCDAWRSCRSRRSSSRPASRRRLAAAASHGASPARVAERADITNVVCVGEATTYLDWLNGDFQPDDPDPIEEADEAARAICSRRSGSAARSSCRATRTTSRSHSLMPTANSSGFDVDVAREIADRLGVDVRFETPEWDAITAGSWSGRWDISVGSMTVTVPRKEALSFTQPYYYAPAALAASDSSGVDSVDAAALRASGWSRGHRRFRLTRTARRRSRPDEASSTSGSAHRPRRCRAPSTRARRFIS